MNRRELSVHAGFERGHAMVYDSNLLKRWTESGFASSQPSQAWLTAVLVGLCGCISLVSGLVSAAEPQFERDIAPILSAKCLRCHGEKKRSGGLDLRSIESIHQGGESGAVVVRGKADASLLLKRIVSGEMPPGDEEKLTAAEVDLVPSGS